MGGRVDRRKGREEEKNEALIKRGKEDTKRRRGVGKEGEKRGKEDEEMAKVERWNAKRRKGKEIKRGKKRIMC